MYEKYIHLYIYIYSVYVITILAFQRASIPIIPKPPGQARRTTGAVTAGVGSMAGAASRPKHCDVLMINIHICYPAVTNITIDI